MNLKQQILEASGRAKVKLIREFKDLKPRDKIKVLREFKKLEAQNPIESFQHMLDNDPHGLLDISGEDLSIFKLENVSRAKSISKAMPEYIAKGEAYKLTSNEEKLFSSMQKMLEDGIAVRAKHNKEKLKKGTFFIVGGVLGFIKNDKLAHDTDKDGEERFELIFSNHTKSYLLKQSLVSALYKKGSSLVEVQVALTQNLKEALSRIKEVLENPNSTKKDFEAIRPDVEFVEKHEESVMGSDLLLEVFDLMDTDVKLDSISLFGI